MLLCLFVYSSHQVRSIVCANLLLILVNMGLIVIVVCYHAGLPQQNLPFTCKEMLKASTPFTVINHTAGAVTLLMRRVCIHSTVSQ